VFLEIDVQETGVDLLSLSGHKLYGPKGIGALFIRREIQSEISPLIHGGGQENGIRSGTLPSMLCLGLGKACEIMMAERQQNAERLEKLATQFWNRLSRKYLDAKINGSVDNRHPGNLNVAFPGFDAHSLIQALQPHVAASTGSACTTGTPEPSHVLTAMGLPKGIAESSVRFSFGLHNTEEEIDRAVDHILAAIEHLSADQCDYIANVYRGEK